MYEAKSSFVTDSTVTDSASLRTEPPLDVSAASKEPPFEATQLPVPWRLISDLLHFVFPNVCLACGETIAWTPPTLPKRLLSFDLGLCISCRQGLITATERACLGCGVTLGIESRHQTVDRSHPGPMAALCGDCAIPSSPIIHRCVSLWSYQPPLDAVLHGLKFQHLPYLSRHLGHAIARHLIDCLDDLEDIDAVVPIPLHWRRRLQRGFDQTYLLAQSIAAGLDLPLRPVLRRRRATAAQSRLSRGTRQRNLEQAFASRLRASPERLGTHVLLVDDVVTTGATLMAAAGALQSFHPCRITAVTVARTPSLAHTSRRTKSKDSNSERD